MRSGRLAYLGFIVAGLCAFLEVTAVTMVVPAFVDRGVSAREAGHLMRSLVESGDRVVLYRVKEGSLGGYLFYAGMTLPNLRTPEDLQDAFEKGGVGRGNAPTLALMQEDIHEEVSRSLKVPTTVVRRFDAMPEPAGWFRGRSMVLVAPEP